MYPRLVTVTIASALLLAAGGVAVNAQSQDGAPAATAEAQPNSNTPAPADAGQERERTQPAAPAGAPVTQSTAPDEGNEGAIARGEYLARHVAMCVQCHTPHDENGALIETELFRGSVLPAESTLRGVQFAFRAPALAGLPGYEPDALVRLLTTGLAKRGGTAQAPMPPFRMNEEDARAIAAYLKSLR